MQVEREQSRQVWLSALGLTPWVASRRLPGACPSRLLPLPLPDEVAEAPASPTQTQAIAPQGNRTPPSETKATSARQAAETPVASTETAPRLCVYQTEQTLVIVEQRDRQAPELDRDEQQLLRALLCVFGNDHRSYPFLCPKQPQQAQDTLSAFAGGLALQGCTRVLLCLKEDACQHLLGKQARYQRFQLADLPALVISSLDEMLQAPLMHKPRSWNSLCEAGFDH